ncbi:MAG TPA: UvrD-helicase domain-containing protein, partial [Acidimicrobiales bacterium]|nr:UvrD-helicase domain-containing protein [Acidimicrobiales bacterium]
MTGRNGSAPAGDGAVSDDDARRRIAGELGTSLVVVAGAGTGKTSALVGRVVGLVRDQRVPLREIAVITFTEAAAAELRARLRTAVEAAAAAAPEDEVLAAAAAELDEAAICTLHAFAQRILMEHALAAGVPPDFDVLDAVAEQAAVEQAVTAFVDRLLDDPSAEPYLLRGLLLGLGQQEILQVAWCLHSNWDRLDDDVVTAIDEARRTHPLAPCRLEPVLAAIDAALALGDRCTNPDDRLLGHLRGRVSDARVALAGVADDEQAAVALLARMPPLTSNLGQKDNWGGDAGE